MATNQNDASDIQVKNVAVSANTPINLPIRGEKRIIPSPISATAQQEQAQKDFGTTGITLPNTLKVAQLGSANLSAARSTLIDWIMVRIPNRGVDSTGTVPDPTAAMVYRFLINPKTINIGHATLDSQTLTRAGWQFGVWGEDVAKISMTGQTAGQYHYLGITDEFAEYTESYRNLAQLQVCFENNGYWFEGEQLGEGPLAANATRRRIKMHNDIQLIVGDFIWYGCFESLSVSQSADNPFLASFHIEFMAWKERFRKTSPYWNNLENNTQRGASYQVYAALVLPSQQGTPSSSLNMGPTGELPFTAPLAPPPQQPPPPPAVSSEQLSQNFLSNPPTELDHSYSPTVLLDKDTPAGIDFWQAA